MSSLSLMALMILHFNFSAPLSLSFLQFCWLHYLFSTSPLFANVLMSEFKLFIYCCCAVSLNEYASLTIHHIMHIWSSQFKYNSSCHSHANLWYKDTFHCPCLSQNTSSFDQQSLQASLHSMKILKLIQIIIKARTHTFMPFLGFCRLVVTLQKNARNLFYPRLHNCLPSHCHIFSLCSFSSFWHAWETFICLCGMVESQPTWSTKDAMRTVPSYFHHLFSKTFEDFLLLIKMYSKTDSLLWKR